jgi:hypothetical protein
VAAHLLDDEHMTVVNEARPTMLGRLLREPLIHFLGLAMVVFVAYRVLAPGAGGGDADRIVVTADKLQQIAERFTQVWKRPPLPQELKALIDDQVKEEIYVREALSLGLDKDDTVIRRRLRQKMELLGDAAADALAPTDAELGAYLSSHQQSFAVLPAVSFEQVFLSTQRHGSDAGQKAAAILASLTTEPDADPSTMGDASLLPVEVPLTDLHAISHMFGEDFADTVGKAKPGVWTGPIASGFGLHVVRVTQSRPGRIPTLGEVRDAVTREWTNERRKNLEADRLGDLLKKYDVVIEYPPATSAIKP